MTGPKIRILIAASIYPPDSGGPALHARRQFDWFNTHGHKAQVVALAHYRHLPGGVRHIFYLVALIFRAYNFEVVYAHDALGAGIPALIAAKLFGRKFVVRVGGDLAWERLCAGASMLEWYEKGGHKGARTFKLTRWLIKRADLIIVPSGLLTNIYTKYYGVTEDKIKTIPNPIPSLSNVEVVTGHSIIFASRLVRYKNLDFVLRVLKNIFTNYSELKFVIMGDGPERKRLQSLSVELEIESRVDFIGTVPQEKVTEEIAKSRFVIAPALTEFNPNYILQCVSIGKPFLMSRENGLPFEIPKELVFDPKNAQDLESKIFNLIEKYGEVKKKVEEINFKMTWEDNLKANLEAVQSLV